MSAPAPGVRDGFVLVGEARRFPGKFVATVDGRRLVDRACASLLAAGLSVSLVSIRAELPSPIVPVIPDRYAGGPLGAVRTILERRAGPFVLVGGDMPWIDPTAIASLLARYRPGRSVVPVHPDQSLEVLHAVYDLPLGRVREFWEARRPLRALLQELRSAEAVELVPVSELPARSLRDVNTPEDLLREETPPV